MDIGACSTARQEKPIQQGKMQVGGRESDLCKDRQDWAQGSVGEGHDHRGGRHDKQALIVHQEAPHAQHCTGDVFLHEEAGIWAVAGAC